MKKVISVRFKENGKSYYFDPAGADIKTGEYVIVETARGIECGEVVQGVKEIADSAVSKALKPITRMKLSMYTNRQLKKSQPSQLRQVDAVVDVTTVEAVVATITTKVDADVADAIKELTIDNFSKGEYIWKHIQTDLFRRVARSRNRRRNRRMPCRYRTRYGIYPK